MKSANCFWTEKFIKHMVLTEFENSGFKYNSTLFLDFMLKRVLNYLSSNKIESKFDIEKEITELFKKTNNKYFQVEQRRILQTEIRNEGVPEFFAEIVSRAYEFDKQEAYFIGKSALGIKVEKRKAYLENEQKSKNNLNLISENQTDGILNKLDLTSIKPSFASKSLEGYWLSRFSYNKKRRDEIIKGIQFDLEYITSTGFSSLTGKNILCINQSGNIYYHGLEMKILDNYIVGTWFNTNTKNIGTMQLHIHNSKMVLEGKHLGNSNDNSIQEGDWVWIRLNTDCEGEKLSFDDIKRKRLIEFDILESRFSEWILNGTSININEIVH